MSIFLSMRFSLLDDADVSQAFAAYLRNLRKQAKLSRAALAERSCVPAATIKKLELTGQISFRQLLLLWQTLDSLDRQQRVGGIVFFAYFRVCF